MDKSVPMIDDGVKITFNDPSDTLSQHLKAIQAAAEKRSYRLMMNLKDDLSSAFTQSGLTLDRAFRSFDENRDGVIDHGEFERGLAAMGASLSASQLSRHRFVRSVREDGGGAGKKKKTPAQKKQAADRKKRRELIAEMRGKAKVTTKNGAGVCYAWNVNKPGCTCERGGACNFSHVCCLCGSDQHRACDCDVVTSG